MLLQLLLGIDVEGVLFLTKVEGVIEEGDTIAEKRVIYN